MAKESVKNVTKTSNTSLKIKNNKNYNTKNYLEGIGKYI